MVEIFVRQGKTPFRALVVGAGIVYAWPVMRPAVACVLAVLTGGLSFSFSQKILFPHRKLYRFLSLLLILSGALSAVHASPAILGFYLLLTLLLISYWGYGDGEDLVFQMLPNWLTGLVLVQLGLWNPAREPLSGLLPMLGYVLCLGLFPFHGWLQLFCERAPLPCNLSYWILVYPSLLRGVGAGAAASPPAVHCTTLMGAFYGIYFGLLAFRKETLLGSIAYFFLSRSGLCLLHAPSVSSYFLSGEGLACGVLYYLSLTFQEREETGDATTPPQRASIPDAGRRALLLIAMGIFFLCCRGSVARVGIFVPLSGILIDLLTAAFLLRLWRCFRKNFREPPFRHP